MQKNRFKRFLIALALGLVMAFLISAYRGLFSVTTTADRMLCLCDGFSVSGLLFLSIGLMALIAGEGGFDVLIYAVMKGLHHIVPGRFGEDVGTYYDYKLVKMEKKKKSPAFLAVAGAVLLGIGLIFMAIWYSMAEI